MKAVDHQVQLFDQDFQGGEVFNDNQPYVLGSEVPATGEHGASCLNNDTGYSADSYVRAFITSLPSTGAFSLNVNGSGSWVPDGADSETATYEGYVDGASNGTADITLNNGITINQVTLDSSIEVQDPEQQVQRRLAHLLESSADISDTVARNARLLRVLSSSLQPTDAAFVLRTLIKTLSSDMTVTDELIRSVVSAGEAVQRTLDSALDVLDDIEKRLMLNRLLSGDVDIVDELVREVIVQGATERTLTDELGVVDAVVKQLHLFGLLTDELALTDELVRSIISGLVVARTVETDAEVFDTLQQHSLLDRDVLSTIVIADELLRHTQLFRQLIEDVGLTDELVAELVRSFHEVVLSDSIDVSDEVITSLVTALIAAGIIVPGVERKSIVYKAE